MKSNGQMRSDWPLIKHLSKTYSPKLGFYWQRLPYVEMPKNILTVPDDTVADTLEHFPWIDAVLHLFVGAPDSEALAEVWARVVNSVEYDRGRDRLSPWQSWRKHPAGKDGLVLFELWVNPFRIGLPPEPDYALVSKTEVWYSGESAFGLYPSLSRAEAAGMPQDRVNAWKEALQDTVHDAMWCAAYLCGCPEYLVEQEPATRVPRKSNDPKPWTYAGLPSIILIDPRKAPAPRNDVPAGGAHASPRPHQRRGHWAELRHPRYRRNEDGTTRKVFVKPAWVGPQEWVMEGARYRVIDTATH